MTQEIRITQPDDWHLHLRDGALLKQVVPYTARHFKRAIVMPNLSPPVVATAQAKAYQERIMQVLPADTEFEPLMTLYLTEQTDPQDLKAGFLSGAVTAVKLYPAGATTNSASGVRDLEKVDPVLAVMEETGIPLLIHGEVVDAEIDIFDREAVFIERHLIPLRKRFPQLKIVFEHITTHEGVEYVKSCEDWVGATVTPHHLVINRNAMLAGGIRPHYYCLPVAKREKHRQALCDVVISGHARFFIGTDSAPHPDHAKHSACGCAGIFNAPNAISTVTQVFDNADALDKLEGFLSLNGPAFYGLPVNTRKMILKRYEQPLQAELASLQGPEGNVTVFDPQVNLHWGVMLEPAQEV